MSLNKMQEGAEKNGHLLFNQLVTSLAALLGKELVRMKASHIPQMELDENLQVKNPQNLTPRTLDAFLAQFRGLSPLLFNKIIQPLMLQNPLTPQNDTPRTNLPVENPAILSNSQNHHG